MEMLNHVLVKTYTIYGYDEKHQKVCSLHPDKNTETWVIFFMFIKSTIRNWRSEKLTTDYELAAMKSLKRVFPQINIK